MGRDNKYYKSAIKTVKIKCRVESCRKQMLRKGLKERRGKYGLLPSPGRGLAEGNKKTIPWKSIFCSEHVINIYNPYHPPVSLAEVNISSYPATEVAGLFFFCRAEILNSGGFVQKYSDQGVSCKNIGQ